MTRLATVAEAMRHEALQNANSTLLASLLDAASEAIVKYCGTEIAAGSTTTETVSGNGMVWIFTRNVPITSFTSAVITEIDGTSTTITSTQVKLMEEQGRIAFDPVNSSGYGRWPKAEWENITLSYAYGYSTVPEGVKQACILMAQELYVSGGFSDPRIQSFSMGEYSETRASRTNTTLVTPAAEMLLSPYRHFRGI